jgi:hypothetical protein
VEFFTCYTLIDITCTGVNDPAQALPYQQHQNFNTFLQFIGLRTQPQDIKVEKLTQRELDDFKFGSKYTGANDVWKITWTIEVQGCVGISELKQDADGIPIHTNLTETVELTSSVLETRDARNRNLYFTKENRPTQT